jgi:hypothetical protein
MSKADKLLKRVEFYEKMASSQKPETDELLNKVSLFERLALYSDRKSFLSAIAQDGPSQIMQTENYIRGAVSALSSAIQEWIGSSAERQGDIPGRLPGLPIGMRGPVQVINKAARDNNYDAATLPSIREAARSLAAVANLGDMSDDAKNAWMQLVFPKAAQLIDLTGKQMKNLQDWANQFGPQDTPPAEIGSGILTIPEVTVQGTPPPKGYPSISKADQQALLRFVTEEGLGFVSPDKMNDGVLGPETRKALELVKDYFKKTYPQNPRMTDPQAITAAKVPRRT